jgi:hypothetical protein
MINNNTRFLGVDSTKVNLTEKKDSINNAVTEYYTAEEIVAPKYKVYTALLTQEGENAPVATVLENNIGNIVWEYVEVGKYKAVSVGLFQSSMVITGVPGSGYVFRNIQNESDSNQILVENFIPSVVIYQNNVLNNTPIEIRVYE